MATTKVNGSRSSLETSLLLQDLLDSPGISASVDLTGVYRSVGAVAAAVEAAARRHSCQGLLRGAAGNGVHLFPSLCPILGDSVYELGAALLDPAPAPE